MYKNIAIRNKGSIIVDAAIALPIFIITIAMLLQVINIVSKEEHAYYTAETSIEAAGLLGSKLELGKTITDYERNVSIDHVQFYTIIKNVKFPFVGAIFDLELLSMDMPYRTYIGESKDIFGDDDMVYIFPKNEGGEKEGPRYHTNPSCQTIKGGITKGLSIEKVTKQEAISRGYSLCLFCQRKVK